MTEAFNKYTDNGDLMDFFFDKIAYNFKILQQKSRLPDSIRSSFDVDFASSQVKNNSPRSDLGSEDEEDHEGPTNPTLKLKKLYPTTNSNTAAGLILLITAKNNKTNLLNYLINYGENNTQFIKTYMINPITVLKMKTIFNRNILHFLAGSKSVENLKNVVGKFHGFEGELNELRGFEGKFFDEFEA